MYLFFDVETNGLHGEAFAVGWVITDNNGKLLREGICNAQLRNVAASVVDPELGFQPDPWVLRNVVPHLPEPNVETPRGVRLVFSEIAEAAEKNATRVNEKLYFAADVCYPCETSFLLKCASERNLSVYPLVDVASTLLAKGYDPVATYKRNPDELPAHNPLNDARQSARIFFAAMRGEPLETV